MYEKYYVIDEFGDIVGDTQFNAEKCRYVAQVFSFEYTFISNDEMQAFLWGLGLEEM